MVDNLDDIDWQGYSLEFHTLQQSKQPVLAIYLRQHLETWETLAFYECDSPANGWQKIAICRSNNGGLTISLNGSTIMSIHEADIAVSEYFIFDAEDCGITRFDPSIHQDVFVQAQEGPSLDNLSVHEIDSDFNLSEMHSRFGPAAGVCILVALALLQRENLTRKSRS
jgi:hypothetical protein